MKYTYLIIIITLNAIFINYSHAHKSNNFKNEILLLTTKSSNKTADKDAIKIESAKVNEIDPKSNEQSNKRKKEDVFIELSKQEVRKYLRSQSANTVKSIKSKGNAKINEQIESINNMNSIILSALTDEKIDDIKDNIYFASDKRDFHISGVARMGASYSFGGSTITDPFNFTEGNPSIDPNQHIEITNHSLGGLIGLGMRIFYTNNKDIFSEISIDNYALGNIMEHYSFPSDSGMAAESNIISGIDGDITSNYRNLINASMRHGAKINKKNTIFRNNLFVYLLNSFGMQTLKSYEPVGDFMIDVDSDTGDLQIKFEDIITRVDHSFIPTLGLGFEAQISQYASFFLEAYFNLKSYSQNYLANNSQIDRDEETQSLFGMFSQFKTSYGIQMGIKFAF